MTALTALAQQQPAALWLAAGAVLLAAGTASGWRGLVWAALAGAVAAILAAVSPRSTILQAAAFGGVAVALAALDLRARSTRRAPPASSPPSAQAGDAALLGRTARVRGAFVDGGGEVLVGDAVHPARLAEAGPPLAAGALVRIVRVGEAALVVRAVPA